MLIISDGWETGDPAQLGAQLARLHRIAYRIVWANPRTQSERYRPEVGGMAAAWPYCDAVVSAHNFEALGDLLAALRAPRVQRPSYVPASPTGAAAEVTTAGLGGGAAPRAKHRCPCRSPSNWAAAGPPGAPNAGALAFPVNGKLGPRAGMLPTVLEKADLPPAGRNGWCSS